jgi:methyltransferase (TIGR00027 family)
MKQSRSSLTAQGIAYTRAFETNKPANTRLCYDPLAHYFVAPWFWFTASLFMGYARRRSQGVQEFLAIRARYADDYLRACLNDGLEQLVILGAGFDTKAYRFEQLRGRVKVFEVDHPATQEVKRAKLARIFGTLPDYVTYVPIDFNEQTLERRLNESGYDERLKTLVSWEGVTMYLHPGAVDSTLDFVARHTAPGSAILFDYIYTSALGERKPKEIASMQRYRRLTGEGLVFGIARGVVRQFLEQRGFGEVEDADHQKLASLYLTGPNAGKTVAPIYAIVHAIVKGAGHSK